MSDQAAYSEGQQAAREDIPAKANPHKEGTVDFKLWREGHDSVASEIEASQSEG